MKGKKIVASIEARMTSNRLPGKVLMEATSGVSMLEYMINRVKKSRLIDDIIVATTVNKEDNGIIDLCKKLNIKYYRGSEHDVLLRVLEAHEFVGSDLIVELTGDCPLIDPVVVDKVIQKYLKNNYDYVSNTHIKSYPDGFDVEIFSLDLRFDDKKLKTIPIIFGESKAKLLAVLALLIAEGLYIIQYFEKTRNISFTVRDVVQYIKSNPNLLELTKDASFEVQPYTTIANRNE